MTRLAVIYYSATGTVHALAEAIRDGAEETGVEVRMLRAAELAPQEAIEQNPQWAEHHKATQDIPEATMDDLEWADAVVWGSPTRFGNIASQLKQVIDQAGGLWAKGALEDKVMSGFTSAATKHGGHESTLLALYHTMYHWGAIVVTPGYAGETQQEAGTPYGATHISNNGEIPPGEVELASARFQGKRVANLAKQLEAARVAA